MTTEVTISNTGHQDVELLSTPSIGTADGDHRRYLKVGECAKFTIWQGQSLLVKEAPPTPTKEPSP